VPGQKDSHTRRTESKGSGQIVKRKGYPIEVQLRTIGQDIWANTVEERGREFGIDFKFGAGGAHDRAVFGDMGKLIASFDRAELSPEDLREGLKRLPSLTMQRGTQGSSK
jgi:hypothetical protein